MTPAEVLDKLLPRWRATLPARYTADYIEGFITRNRAALEVVVDDGGIEATCAVSKGTYIRSLAEELGRRAGLPAHLAALRRLACGAFTLEHPGARVLSASRLPDRPGTPQRGPPLRPVGRFFRALA